MALRPYLLANFRVLYYTQRNAYQLPGIQMPLSPLSKQQESSVHPFLFVLLFFFFLYIIRKLNSKISFPPRCNQGFVSLLNMCLEADYQFLLLLMGFLVFARAIGYGITSRDCR
ncbi:hypothetical protein CEXT_68691 [Caerostris extrusa]|uniref:Uncharacterized protein n=1 Tax=Caerostris extrusa TaxID=172846 RepID=A0AAV4T597_CAEEX|nr:hypothetical protein CEXT_68691 [Caerostris extrusa]